MTNSQLLEYLSNDSMGFGKPEAAFQCAMQLVAALAEMQTKLDAGKITITPTPIPPTPILPIELT